MDLFGHASAYDPGVYGRHQKKVNDLLDLWERKGYYQSAHIEELRETVRNAAQSGYPTKDQDSRRSDGTVEEINGQSKNAPYIMPAAHGDSSTPFYDLPAANMMPHIIPNLATPINPQLVKPLQFVSGPGDETLAAAVKDLMKDVETLYKTTDHQGEDVFIDIDALGQPAIRDEITGEVIGGEGYYGWSKAFCEKMKMKHHGKDRVGQDAKRDQSSDRSVSPRKRRRLSYSESSRSRSRSRSRATLLSPSRSRSRTGNLAQERRRRSYSKSRSASRRGRTSERRMYDSPRSPQRSRRRPSSRSRSRSRTRSYSPNAYRATSAALQPPTGPQPPGSAPSPALPFPNTFNGAFTVPPTGLPIPPPPPANYKGIWPPPPPPLPPSLMHGHPPPAQANPFPSFPNFVPPPPPPPANPGPFSGSSSPPVPYGIMGHYNQAQMTPIRLGRTATWEQQWASVRWARRTTARPKRPRWPDAMRGQKDDEVNGS